MVFTDTYLHPDVPDPVLDEEAVVAAARRHEPQAGRLLRVDESGGEARAYHLEGDVVLKTQRPHRLRPRTSLRKEALILDELARQGDFPVPRALGYGHVEGIEYLCLTRVHGHPIEDSSLDAGRRAAALGELGRLLRALHGIDQTALAGSDLIPGDRAAADLRGRIAGIFERLETALSASAGSATVRAVDLRRLAGERLELVPDSTPPVTLHSNPGPEHAFVDESTGGLTGLIDFGDAYRSHPAFDLRPWTDPEDAAALMGGYRSVGPLPAGFEDMWRTCLIVTELARAARGTSSGEELQARLERLERLEGLEGS